MRLVIFSDDLTGASGVASMINNGKTITVNYENLSYVDLERFDYLSLNLSMRDSSPDKALKRMEKVLSKFSDDRMALRIDSNLRGSISVMVRSIIERQEALLTDTIPEYDRFTENGYSVFSGDRKSITETLDFRREVFENSRLTVSDSRTYADLDTLAETCISRNLVPMDPGPMIARYALKLGSVSDNSAMKLVNTPKSGRTAVLIGTYREVTEKQVRFLEERGFHFLKPSTHPRNTLDLYKLRLDSDRKLIDNAFINHLSGYDTIILSGGSTANYVLKKSGFLYIENHESIMPLVSTGTIKGGSLDGINLVLKGGLIGNDLCYLDILKYVGVLND